MSEPITPDKLRELADGIAGASPDWPISAWQPEAPAALRAAADEIERLAEQAHSRGVLLDEAEADVLDLITQPRRAAP